MSFDTTIAHLRTQLTDGATRRRRTEHRRRVAASSAAALAVIVVAGALALAPEDDTSNVLTTTAMSTEQRAVCDAFLDVLATSSIALPNADATARVVDLSSRLPDDDPLSAGRDLTTPDAPRFADAYNALDFGCRDLGHPDFNPVYVAPPLPGPVTVPEPYASATRQPFRGSTQAPADFKRPIDIGPNMSTVQTAVTEAGAFVTSWSFEEGNGRRRTCIVFGSAGMRSGSCGSPDLVRFSDALSILTGGTRSRLTAVATSDAVASVVALASDGRAVIQQPVLGRVVIVWAEPAPDVVTVRGFAADGSEVACRSSAGTSC